MDWRGFFKDLKIRKNQWKSVKPVFYYFLEIAHDGEMTKLAILKDRRK
ncbi:hypothetical protein [Desulforamulus ruminis]|nr:hypothetical protein [Desulforamulus ruminis]